MSLFYYDEKIADFETRLDYSPILAYLEKLFSEKKDLQYLITLIVDSWYYAIEGDVNQSPKDYNNEYLLKIWKRYHAKAVNEYQNNAEVCFVAGYCFYLHGIHISDVLDEDVKIGLQLVNRCLELTADVDLKKLAQNFVDNSNIKKYKNYKRIEDAENICKKMFPSESMIDKYFREMLIKG